MGQQSTSDGIRLGWDRAWLRIKWASDPPASHQMRSTWASDGIDLGCDWLRIGSVSASDGISFGWDGVVFGFGPRFGEVHDRPQMEAARDGIGLALDGIGVG